MLLNHISTAALGLALAQAFLLVPEITESTADTVKALPFETVAIAETKSIDLACPGCELTIPFAGTQVKVPGGKSHLELGFTIEHRPEGDRLLVNDFDLYPNTDPFNQILKAVHKPDACKKMKHKALDGTDVNAIVDYIKKTAGDAKARIESEISELTGSSDKKVTSHIDKVEFAAVPLGFSLVVSPVAQSESDGMELIALDLQVIEVANKFVSDIPNVHVKLVRMREGALMIGSIETTGSQNAAQAGQGSCTSLICKWTAFVESIMAKVKPFSFKHCGGKKGMGAGAGTAVDPAKIADGKALHSHHRHHPGHRAHKHSLGQLFKNIVSHVVLPILIGIVAGVSVSLIGMAVGTCIVALWRLFFRRHHHRRIGRAHHRAAQKEAAAAEEKAGLMVEQEEVPPAYEEGDVKK